MMKTRIPGFHAPYRLLWIHTVLVIFFMFAWTQRWFLTDIPFDCFYGPLFFVSGPVVHTIAHVLEHWSERHILPDAGLWFHWNLVPGVTCLLLGGLQWWGIETVWMRIRKKMKSGSNHTPEGICQPADGLPKPSP